MSDPVLQWVAALLVFALTDAVARLVGPWTWRRVLTVIGAGVGVGAAVFVANDAVGLRSDLPATLLDAAMAATLATAVAIVAIKHRGAREGGIFALAWGVLALAPMLVLTVGIVPGVPELMVGMVDHGGVLATHVATAAAVLVLALMPGQSTGGAPLAVRATRTLPSVLFVTVAATAWLLGVDRILGGASGRIIGNTLGAIVIGVVTWMLMQRIVGRARPPHGMALGALLGWASVAAATPFLSPIALIATAVFGTSAGATVLLRSSNPDVFMRRGAISVALSAATGGVVIALMADGYGLAETGSLTGALGALFMVSLVFIVSAAVALLAWTLAALLGRGTRLISRPEARPESR